MKKKGSEQDPPNTSAIGKERNRANRRKTLYGAAYIYGLLFAFCGVLIDLAGHNATVAILTLICMSIGIWGSFMFAFMRGKGQDAQ